MLDGIPAPAVIVQVFQGRWQCLLMETAKAPLYTSPHVAIYPRVPP